MTPLNIKMNGMSIERAQIYQKKTLEQNDISKSSSLVNAMT